MTRHFSRVSRDRRGATLIAVLLIALVVAAIVVLAAATTANADLIAKNSVRSEVLYDAAESGVAEARNWINTHPNQLPFRSADSGEMALENNVQVNDALGTPIPGMYRTTWIGKSGSRTGEYGIFGAVISQVTDGVGNTVVHRATIYQDTFAKYAYFSNSEAGIYFGGGDQIFGPAHSNDNIRIAASGVEFHNQLTTSKTIVTGLAYGIFDQGYQQHVPVINLPSVNSLTSLKGLATVANTEVAGSGTVGSGAQSTIRIEFVPVDLNNDGNTTDPDEGFMRVFQSTDARYVTAGNFGQNDYGDVMNANDDNCGSLDPVAHTFTPVSSMTGGPWTVAAKEAALGNGQGHCYLGGDPNLNPGVGLAGKFMATGWPGSGQWLPNPLPMDPRLGAAGANRPDSLYLWPITHAENVNFNGVVFVDGKVAISGTLRGRLTLVSPYNIIVAGNVKLNTDPAVGTCPDYLGAYAADDVVVADNFLNAPQAASTTPGDSVWQFEIPSPTKSTYLQASILALNKFQVENYIGGVIDGLNCEIVPAGRGCLYLTGGIIQGTRGPVGTMWADGDSGETGYIKRYQFNECGLTLPPPYFPTTGRFSEDRSYEMSPVNFNEHAWFVIPSLAAQDSLLQQPVPPPPPPPVTPPTSPPPPVSPPPVPPPPVVPPPVTPPVAPPPVTPPVAPPPVSPPVTPPPVTPPVAPPPAPPPPVTPPPAPPPAPPPVAPPPAPPPPAPPPAPIVD